MGLSGRQIIHSIPLYITYGLGTVICGMFAFWAAIVYILVCVAGNLWFIVTICPNCRAYDRGCPSGYNLCAQKLAKKGDPALFQQAFRRNVGVVALSWFVPLIFASLILIDGWDVSLIIVLSAFLVLAFGVLPFGMRVEGCARCPNKKDCPYAAKK